VSWKIAGFPVRFASQETAWNAINSPRNCDALYSALTDDPARKGRLDGGNAVQENSIRI
jgi:hypothetical protein